MKTLRVFAVVSAIGVLSGCFGPGIVPDSTAGDQQVALDLSNVETWFMPAESAGDQLLLSGQTDNLYRDVHAGLWWPASTVFPAIQAWSSDLPPTYEHPDVPDWTVTWSESAGIITWEVDYLEGSFVLTLSDAETEASVTLAENGSTYLDGSISYDGLSGSGTVYVEGRAGTQQFDYSWGPSPTPDYQIRISIETPPNQDGFNSTMVIDTDSDGERGEYSGTTLGDSYGPFAWPAQRVPR
jgi:hypothetical protein